LSGSRVRGTEEEAASYLGEEASGHESKRGGLKATHQPFIRKRQYAPPLESYWDRYDSPESRSRGDWQARHVKGQSALSMDESSDIERMSRRLSGHPTPDAF